MITMHAKASLFIYSFLHAYTHSLNIYEHIYFMPTSSVGKLFQMILISLSLIIDLEEQQTKQIKKKKKN